MGGGTPLARSLTTPAGSSNVPPLDTLPPAALTCGGSGNMLTETDESAVEAAAEAAVEAEAAADPAAAAGGPTAMETDCSDGPTGGGDA